MTVYPEIKERVTIEHEAKVNVNDVPFRVKKNVAIVPVLHLQQIADERVASAGEDEILHRFHISF